MFADIIYYIAYGFLLLLLRGQCRKLRGKSASESAKETPFDIIGELTGPAKENISHFLNGDITEIKITDYCVDSGDPPEYVLSDGAKIKEFANLLSHESWSAEDDDVYTAEKFISTKFELKNKQDTVAVINLTTWMVDAYGVAEISGGSRTASFRISERTYFDLRALPTGKYYLHKSDLKNRTRKFPLNYKIKCCTGLMKMKIGRLRGSKAGALLFGKPTS